MREDIKCEKCGNIIKYKPLGANFIVFCPVCKNYLFTECERGYGPVTPCKIYCDDKLIGEVWSNGTNCFLKSDLTDKVIHLKSTYFDALMEAKSIIEKLL